MAEFDDAFIELRGRAPTVEEQHEAICLASIYKRYPALDPLAILVILTGRIPEQVRLAAEHAAAAGQQRGEAAAMDATQRKIEEYARRRADASGGFETRLAFGITLSVILLSVAIGAFIAGRVDTLLALHAAVTWPHIVPWWTWILLGVLVAEIARLVFAASLRRGLPWSGLIASACTVAFAVVTRSVWVR
ncbi:MAG: hypothetical protein GIX03_09220 [Candidatus Eremiobacteraeota bacterium]|nr:hypothetical protein [Candidatus Eremiobacteraeota bacterium]MBC5805928.1 hypothetical protein [Candidatus Eremiobacteraeota bacterium]MBC5825213.1 hypothetical protein [Candidatus Eremiobacteraeota bacterium]